MKNFLKYFFITLFGLSILVTPLLAISKNETISDLALYIIIFISFCTALLLTIRDEKLSGKMKSLKEIEEDLNSRNLEKEALLSEINRLKIDIQNLSDTKNTYKKEIETINKEVFDHFIDGTVIEDFDNISSEEIKSKLSLLLLEEKDFLKGNNGITPVYIKDFYARDFKQEKIEKNNEKQLIRCFENETKMLIDNLTLKNIDTTRNKLIKCFEMLNKIFITDEIELSKKYLEFKYKILELKIALLQKQEEEKITQKEIREQLIEEEKVRKEIEKEKLKIEKEEKQFNKELNKMLSYLQKANSDVEKQLFVDKIKELEEKIKLLEKDKENVLQRETNTRAGYVYIISNIGSFGENVFKIGMTRRLEPLDRINELSSASVPFPFDVHALIFSDDAPKLENTLHKYFEEKSINKVNLRKEFFKIEVNKFVLNELDVTVNFVDIPKAEQYRESLRLSEQNI